jgi:hypothetical protein
MGKKVDLDKMRSIRQGGKISREDSRVRPLISDESGKTTGFEIDNYDGSQSAVVRPDSFHVTTSLSEGTVRVNGQDH